MQSNPDNHGDTDRLRDALERTVPASDFGPDAMRAEAERTAVDRMPDENREQYLRRTASDSAGETDPDDTVGSFGDSSVVPPELSDAPQSTGPRFTVISKLGAGATSQVYAVRDNSLDRTIAVKFLKSARSRNERARHLFLHEARVTARLQHPNIMPIHDIGLDTRQRVFFTMKNVEGGTVGDAIRAESEGRELPPGYAGIGDKLAILYKVCDAAAFAHANGYVHQDIKPDNIMLGRFGEVLLLDWGCALRRDTSNAVSGRAIYGTPAYMSPEQARRETVDERSDVYCLGATLYHMLTLQYPTWADDPERFWELKRAGVLNCADAAAEERVPAPLLDVCRKAMAPEPSARYQDALAFRDALHEYEVHAESIQLTADARERLTRAETAGDYDLYSEVTHDLRQARRMWPGNDQAAELLLRARCSYASCALDRGDIRLAENLVGDEPAFRDIHRRIAAARARESARRRRVRALRIAAAVLGMAVIAFVSYLIVDYFRYFGSWRVVYHWDSSQGPPQGLSRSVRASAIDETSPDFVRFDGNAIAVPEHVTFWFQDIRVPGDVRLEVGMMWPVSVDGFECHIQARQEMPPEWWMCFPGFACQFGGSGNRDNFISRNEVGRVPEGGLAVAASFESGKWYQLAFERRGDKVAMYIDGREILSRTELLPLPGKGFDRIAFRAWDSVRVRSLTVRRMSLPRKASPLVVGDAAVVRRDFRDAVEQYLTVAEDFADDPIAERALAKAYLVASQLSGASDSIIAVVRARLAARFPRSSYWPVVREADCITAWKEGERWKALELLGAVMAQDPDTRLAMRLLALSDATELPDSMAQELLRLVGKTTRVNRLELGHRGLRSLEPLRGMPLAVLNARCNHIGSLEPLRGMPLIRIDVSNNAVTDLSPIRGMSLRSINIAGNPIASLEPLRGMPLKLLEAAVTEVENLEPLAGMPLHDIDVAYSRVVSLEPLREMRLEVLNVARCPVESLEPLAGMQLRELDIRETAVNDLRVLRGMPLSDLRFAGTPVADLSPLAACTTLQLLELENSQVRDLEPIRGLQLSVIDASGTMIADLSPLRDMPLRELVLDSSRVTSLAPVRGIALERLQLASTAITDLSPIEARRLLVCRLQNTDIQDLAPLKGAPLTWLDITGAAVRDLSPLDPPPQALALSFGELTPEHVLATARRWRRWGHTDGAQALETLVALEKGEHTRVRAMAVRHKGHRYLPVVCSSTYDEADSICSLLGAHLVTITSREELAFVQGLLRKYPMQCWLGLDRVSRPQRWMTGEPITIRMNREPSRPGEKLNWYQQSGGNTGWFHDRRHPTESGFIAEWDN
ncbi:MAG: protein kinase [Chitinivibrionales bacterium]|nr:protein kinase [Chitinivibrionales bacterium]